MKKNTSHQSISYLDIEHAWSQALDHLDDPIYVVDLDDHILLANQAFYTKVKSNPEEAVGKRVTDFTHPEGEESPCKVCQARQALQDTQIVLEANDPVNKAGVPMEISIKVVRDQDNKPQSIIQKMTDLTSIRETQRLIKQNEVLFRGLLNATPEPLVVSDQGGTIRLVNDEFTKQFGFTRSEIIGQTIEVLVPQDSRHLHQSHRHDYMKSPVARPNNLLLEVNGLHKDGHIIPLEIHLSPLKVGDETVIISSMHDLTERNANERELRRLASFPAGSPIPIIEFNKKGTITYCNPVAKEHWPNIEKLSFKHPILMGIESLFHLFEHQKEMVRDIEAHEVIYEQKITYFKELDLFRIYSWDITKIRNMSSEMTYLANHDALTGLLNRREFETRLEEAIQSTLYKQEQHVLCYMDLDQFKIVNDSCGHIAGDELLKQLGTLLQEQVRNNDSLARLGGDEFGLLLSGCPIEKAEAIADTLRKAIEGFRFCWADKCFKVGVSIGLINIDMRTSNLSDILRAADTACYMAKELGRNRIQVYHHDDEALSKHSEQISWFNRIHDALDQGSFVLFCQKIHAVNENNSSFFEILLRMKGADEQLIPPNAFIPAAERFNLMAYIDHWVIENTINLMAQTAYQVYDFSINLSGQTLNNKQVMQYIIDHITEVGIKPERICFEITETVMVANLNAAIEGVTKIRNLGCKIALDDFGSGVSSFGYLKNLPVDYLKIDGSLVKDIVDDPIHFAMVESIIQVGKIMQLQIVAEYVENDAISRKLEIAGIDYLQGYGIDMPVSVAKISDN